jgi:hypothetical protein
MSTAFRDSDNNPAARRVDFDKNYLHISTGTAFRDSKIITRRVDSEKNYVPYTRNFAEENPSETIKRNNIENFLLHRENFNQMIIRGRLALSIRRKRNQFTTISC